MMNFTKNNLMTGDMIELANGKRATIMRETPAGDIARFHTEKDSFSYLDTRYNEDLTHTKHRNMDIVKVYRVDPVNIPMNEIGDLVANPDKMAELGMVVFDRTASTTPTIESLITGDMLVHRNGKVSTVYKNTPVGDITRYHTEGNSFSYLRRYDNDTMKHESKDTFDIIAVFRVKFDNPATIGDFIANPIKMLTPENLVWADGDFAARYTYRGIAGGFEYVSGERESSDYDSEDIEDDEDLFSIALNAALEALNRGDRD